ncbi:hypothetical protein [Clostridium perfringens]|uniref:hypothetical protein n=1 Tax=Clostridium perfringens TaxID=1502 RepID=UPI000DA2BB6C|nr:hypothetical protein [Clostridium perfringens]MDM0495267.1 hypothetical protein [Clostridium perfringens]SQI01973.1 Uncharacterised protein [Clostridium perfringens]
MEDCKNIQDVKSMEEILEELISLDESKDFNYDDEIYRISEELILYYDNKGRHLYSEVSAFLYKFKDEEENLEYIYRNIKKVHNVFSESGNKDYAINALKLEDHIRLELLRFENLKQAQEKNALELSTKIDEETIKFEQATNTYKKNFSILMKSYETMRNNIDGLNSQIISVIGIFSAIVITFFGGINFLESVLNSIGKVSKYRFVLGAFIVGFVMFNTIFMLLNFISKLTEKNIRSECRYYKNGYCDSECKIRGKIKCVKEKHPTIYWVNICFILGIISIVIIYYIDYYNIISWILF